MIRQSCFLAMTILLKSYVMLRQNHALAVVCRRKFINLRRAYWLLAVALVILPEVLELLISRLTAFIAVLRKVLFVGGAS